MIRGFLYLPWIIQLLSGLTVGATFARHSLLKTKERTKKIVAIISMIPWQISCSPQEIAISWLRVLDSDHQWSARRYRQLRLDWESPGEARLNIGINDMRDRCHAQPVEKGEDKKKILAILPNQWYRDGYHILHSKLLGNQERRGWISSYIWTFRHRNLNPILIFPSCWYLWDFHPLFIYKLTVIRSSPNF